MRYIAIRFINGDGLTKTKVVICEDDFNAGDIDFNEDILAEYAYFCEHSGNSDNFETRKKAYTYFANCRWKWYEIDESTWFDMIERGYNTND